MDHFRFWGRFGIILDRLEVILSTFSAFGGSFGVFLGFILKTFGVFLYLLSLPKLFAWAPVGTFFMLLFFRVSFPFFLGVGREVSKAQRVWKVRPQGALFMARLRACCVVLLFFSWRLVARGIWLHALSWGKLEVCQRPPASIP